MHGTSCQARIRPGLVTVGHLGAAESDATAANRATAPGSLREDGDVHRQHPWDRGPHHDPVPRVVTAQGVLGVNAFKDVGAGMRNIFGGRAKSHENELASGVSDVLAEMETQAAHLGADAVVGVDIDYETVGNNMLMVSTSGTVKLG